jgi:hypothetical protein
MDVTRSFKYVFEDKDWIKKVLIGGVLNIIPVIGQAFMWGYGLRQLKNVKEGRELPLPEWNDWGGDLMRGIMVFLGYLVYAIPLIILAIFSGIFGGLGTTAVLTAARAGRAGGPGIWGFCVGVIALIQFIYGIALAVWLPAALLNYVNVGSFMGFLKFADILAIIKNNLKDYITVVLMWLAAAIVAGIVGGIVCGVGALFTMFIANLIFVHLLGQFGASISGSAAPFSGIPTTPAADTTFTMPQQ